MSERSDKHEGAVKPALSAEEWAEIRPLPWTVENMHGWLEQPIDEPHDFLRVAALCLHGQPFGFTWADVDALRRTADMARSWDEAIGDPDRFESLAARIEALLPPRDP